jgi:hypothetical protein
LTVAVACARVRWEPSGSSSGPVSSRKRRHTARAAPRWDRGRVELVEQRRRPLGVALVKLAERDLLKEVVAPEQLVGASPLSRR